ncbi:MAG: hypothetical protein MAG451_01167 [Anaerolineales bacterium]|nr:hypothetical protein [Anaerolineales bacterium]
MEQVYVERWIEVAGSDGTRVPTGQPHAEPLVVPQALIVEAIDAQGEGEQRQEENEEWKTEGGSWKMEMGLSPFSTLHFPFSIFYFPFSSF